jgi:hypothetical protein
LKIGGKSTPILAGAFRHCEGSPQDVKYLSKKTLSFFAKKSILNIIGGKEKTLYPLP